MNVVLVFTCERDWPENQNNAVEAVFSDINKAGEYMRRVHPDSKLTGDDEWMDDSWYYWLEEFTVDES